MVTRPQLCVELGALIGKYMDARRDLFSLNERLRTERLPHDVPVFLRQSLRGTDNKFFDAELELRALSSRLGCPRLRGE